MGDGHCVVCACGHQHILDDAEMWACRPAWFILEVGQYPLGQGCQPGDYTLWHAEHAATELSDITPLRIADQAGRRLLLKRAGTRDQWFPVMP